MTKHKPNLLLSAVLMFVPVGLMAHPHMAITSSCRFVWKADKLAGAYLDWGFDAYFGADIIRGYDINHNGAFDAAETKAVHDNAFINLENYYFFTFIRQGDVRSNPKEVSDFSVHVKDGVLHYRFFIDLSTYEGDLYIAVYDYTYFCAISYPENSPVTFDCDPAVVTPSAEITENKKYPVYYDPLGAANDTTVHYTWRKGLQTFYPREIHLSYALARR